MYKDNLIFTQAKAESFIHSFHRQRAPQRSFVSLVLGILSRDLPLRYTVMPSRVEWDVKPYLDIMPVCIIFSPRRPLNPPLQGAIDIATQQPFLFAVSKQRLGLEASCVGGNGFRGSGQCGRSGSGAGGRLNRKSREVDLVES